MNIFSRIASMVRRTSPDRTNQRDVYSTWPRVAETGDFVTADRGLQVAAFWRGINVLCGGMSQLPWRVMERTGLDAVPAQTHPAWDLLNHAPNPTLDPATFVEYMLGSCLLWGNGYAEIERTGGRPVNLWPIEPWRVVPVQAGDEVVYEVTQNVDEDPIYLLAADVLHFRGIGDLRVGFSVLRQAANALGLQISGEAANSSQMRTSMRPSGVMSPAGNATVKAETLEALKAKYDQEMVGARSAGKVLWLNHGFQFASLAIPNDDMQLLESRQFGVLEIARFVGVPPTMLYDQSSATYNNNEQQALDFLTYSLMPWLRRFEQQANRKLITHRNKSKYYTKFTAQALLRSDMASRGAFYKELFNLGALTPNEIRRMEDLEGLSQDAADETYIQMNMTTLEQAGEPEPEPEPELPPEDVTLVEDEDTDPFSEQNRFGNNGRN